MTKPFSETHSTLWSIVNPKEIGYRIPAKLFFDVQQVQTCTVDVAEHKLVLADYGKCVALCADAEAEIVRLQKESDGWKTEAERYAQNKDFWLSEAERLQKELEFSTTQLNDIRNEQFNKGLVEGERRAMKLVKNVLQHKSKLWRPSGASENRATKIKVCAVLDEVWNELGLVEVQQ